MSRERVVGYYRKGGKVRPITQSHGNSGQNFKIKLKKSIEPINLFVNNGEDIWVVDFDLGTAERRSEKSPYVDKSIKYKYSVEDYLNKRGYKVIKYNDETITFKETI